MTCKFYPSTFKFQIIIDVTFFFILVWFICNNWPEKYFNLLSKTDWNKTTFFRYDCRGHLYKLDDFDFPNNPGIKSSKLSTEEMDIESILDEERYLDLNRDTTEDEILEGSVTRKFLLLSIFYVLYLLFLCLLVSVKGTTRSYTIFWKSDHTSPKTSESIVKITTTYCLLL